MTENKVLWCTPNKNRKRDRDVGDKNGNPFALFDENIGDPMTDKPSKKFSYIKVDPEDLEYTPEVQAIMSTGTAAQLKLQLLSL
jgi:hypothetical protein